MEGKGQTLSLTGDQRALLESLLLILLKLRKGMSGSYGGSFIFTSLRTRHAVFHSDRAVLKSYQQCTRFPFCPEPHQHLLFPVVFCFVLFWVVALLVSVR